ncbi:hypothetical protein B0H14DRAFT_1389246 [Mycena olivaceomarginata]|nr:hypothetical protein B0H14DRAFT_1389246 [Mycena olivaceomarginata]
MLRRSRKSKRSGLDFDPSRSRWSAQTVVGPQAHASLVAPWDHFSAYRTSRSSNGILWRPRQTSVKHSMPGTMLRPVSRWVSLSLSKNKYEELDIRRAEEIEIRKSTAVPRNARNEISQCYATRSTRQARNSNNTRRAHAADSNVAALEAELSETREEVAAARSDAKVSSYLPSLA